MPKYLTIPDSVYVEAAKAIADIFNVNSSSDAAPTVEKILRSYVYLGSHDQILDWSYSLTDNEKNSVIESVRDRNLSVYTFKPEYGTTLNAFEIMETLAVQGSVSPRLARPREAQAEYVLQQQQGYQSPGLFATIQKTIEQFFGGVKTSVESAFKGLGIDISFEMVVAIIVVIVLISMGAFRSA